MTLNLSAASTPLFQPPALVLTAILSPKQHYNTSSSQSSTTSDLPHHYQAPKTNPNPVPETRLRLSGPSVCGGSSGPPREAAVLGAKNSAPCMRFGGLQLPASPFPRLDSIRLDGGVLCWRKLVLHDGVCCRMWRRGDGPVDVDMPFTPRACAGSPMTGCFWGEASAHDGELLKHNIRRLYNGLDGLPLVPLLGEVG